MPRAKKEEAAHDCKADCAELHAQIAELKKEIEALKKAPKGGSGADPRVDKVIQYLKARLAERQQGEPRADFNKNLKNMVDAL